MMGTAIGKGGMNTLENTRDAGLGAAGRSFQPHQPRHNPDGSGGLGPKYLRTEDLLNRHGDNFADRLIVRLAERIIGIDTINAICIKAGTPWPSSRAMIDHSFKELDIKWRITNPEMFAQLPEGPAVFVANHPYGMADAFAMNNMLEEYRRDFRLFANTLLTSVDSITHRLLFVDPFGSEKHRSMNRRSVISAMKHLKEGGDLAIFPGRICSHLKWGQLAVQDDLWTDQIRSFAEAGNAHIVPMHISGRNSWLFQAVGLVHPKLRTLLLLREFLRGGHDFTFTLGEPVPAAKLVKASRAVSAGALMRALTYCANPKRAINRKEMNPPPVRAHGERAGAPVNAKSVEKILAGLPMLAKHGDLEVYNAEQGLPKELALAVGRLRFDAYSGEAAVARPEDMIDRFDPVYSHLLLWDHKKKRLAGTYRYVIPSRVTGGLNQGDLVTASIFRLRRKFLDILPRSMELGRAAIGPEYQRGFAPLMMMWRGIMEILAADRSIKYLFGPLTISQAYSPLSRHILKRFMERKLSYPEFEGAAVARHPYNVKMPPEVNAKKLAAKAENLVDIGSIIEASEAGRRKLPVLHRQYANFGMRCIATGEWPELDHAMASLAVLDLARADRSFISRYIDKGSADDFFQRR